MEPLALAALVVAVAAALAAGALLARRGAAGLERELRERAGRLEADNAELRARAEAERDARVQAEARLAAERESVAEQRALVEAAETRLKESFSVLAANALRENRGEFLQLAGQRLDGLHELMKQYQQRLAEIEKERADAYGGLKAHLETLARAHDGLQREAHTLSTALRSPTVRGRWGEVTLRRVVELAGMSPHCDFDEQATTRTDEGRLRPDMVIRLPNRRAIVVDSKVPLEAYLEAMECADDASRRDCLARHAKAVRERMRALGQKAYAATLETSPDFVVLFLPGESFFSAALEQDRSLIEDGMRSGVVLATPTTLIALLRAVAYGWQQQELAENARRVAALGRELYDRVGVFADHLGKVGRALGQAGDAFNKAVASYESRLLPGARNLAELGADGGRELPDLERLERPLRTLAGASDNDVAG